MCFVKKYNITFIILLIKQLLFMAGSMKIRQTVLYGLLEVIASVNYITLESRVI